MDEEKLPAELKLKIMQAEKEINEAMPKKFDWKRGVFIAILTGFAFFAVGIVARAPIGSAVGFALCGAVTGLLVGAMNKPKRYDR